MNSKRKLEVILASSLTLFVFYIATWFTDLSTDLETLLYVVFGIVLGTIIFYRLKSEEDVESE